MSTTYTDAIMEALKCEQGLAVVVEQEMREGRVTLSNLSRVELDAAARRAVPMAMAIYAEQQGWPTFHRGGAR